jgi:hypothetical protein
LAISIPQDIRIRFPSTLRYQRLQPYSSAILLLELKNDDTSACPTKAFSQGRTVPSATTAAMSREHGIHKSILPSNNRYVRHEFRNPSGTSLWGADFRNGRNAEQNVSLLWLTSGGALNTIGKVRIIEGFRDADENVGLPEYFQ